MPFLLRVLFQTSPFDAKKWMGFIHPVEATVRWTLSTSQGSSEAANFTGENTCFPPEVEERVYVFLKNRRHVVGLLSTKGNTIFMFSRIFFFRGNLASC